MTCNEFLEAMRVASIEAIPVHLFWAFLAFLVGWYVFRRTRALDKEGDLEGEREFFYKAGIVVCAVVMVVFLGLAAARLHSVSNPADSTRDVKFYCAENPPTRVEKAR